jgi:hypothetical protein
MAARRRDLRIDAGRVSGITWRTEQALAIGSSAVALLWVIERGQMLLQ